MKQEVDFIGAKLQSSLLNTGAITLVLGLCAPIITFGILMMAIGKEAVGELTETYYVAPPENSVYLSAIFTLLTALLIKSIVHEKLDMSKNYAIVITSLMSSIILWCIALIAIHAFTLPSIYGVITLFELVILATGLGFFRASVLNSHELYNEAGNTELENA